MAISPSGAAIFAGWISGKSPASAEIRRQCPMALTATIYVFTVRLSHVDRGIYETLELRLARHPSESPEYLVTRLLAYCLEFTEGIAFSKGGLSEPDEPAIMVRDLTGALQGWIEIGMPDAARLHKAAKAAKYVAVYPTRDVTTWLARLAGERIHRAEQIAVQVIDAALLAQLAAKLERRMDFDLSVSEGTVYLSMGETTLTGAVERVALAG
jgi:uncharacterized protein YaeQ